MLLPIVPLQPIELTPEELERGKKNKLVQRLKEEAVHLYESKEAEFPIKDEFREVERIVLLKAIDTKWMNHIDDMDQLRQSIGLQAFAQRNPVDEYKLQGYDMFQEMTEGIEEDTPVDENAELAVAVRIGNPVLRERFPIVLVSAGGDAFVDFFQIVFFNAVHSGPFPGITRRRMFISDIILEQRAACPQHAFFVQKTFTIRYILSALLLGIKVIK